MSERERVRKIISHKDEIPNSSHSNLDETTVLSKMMSPFHQNSTNPVYVPVVTEYNYDPHPTLDNGLGWWRHGVSPARAELLTTLL